MIYCQRCGHQNPGASTICEKCSASLGASCPTCGQLVLPEGRFCSNCGQHLTAPVPDLETSKEQAKVLKDLQGLMPSSLAQKVRAALPELSGERREVTVLDLSIGLGSTTRTELSSEAAYLTFHEVVRLFVQVIYEYEGTIDKYTGDGLTALFGVPVAHENDPERAVRAALAMRPVLQPLKARVRRDYGLELELRTGIHTGMVIAGKTGSDRSLDYTVVGDTIELAARLQAAAEPGTTLTSFATYQRTRPIFQYRALTTSPAKLQPNQAFRPLRPQSVPGSTRGLPGRDVPMVGRHDSLATLQDALQKVRQLGQPSVVFVRGEAGVGKSRLLSEFRTRVQPGTSLYQGRCLAYDRSQPFGLLADLLRSMIQVADTESIEAQRYGLSTYLGNLDLPIDELEPHLLEILTLDSQQERPGVDLSLVDGSVRQKLSHAAIRQVLMAEVRLGPTVLVLDDLHWMDPASRDFLKQFIATVNDVPLLLIIVAREAEGDTVLRPLVSAAAHYGERSLDLFVEPLSDAETRVLVDRLLPPTEDEDTLLNRRIVERAEGNPFFAEEIVRMLLDLGGLARHNGSYQITPLAHGLVEEVPGTLKGLIQARMDRLPDGSRVLLRTAAVLGPVFPGQLLERVSGLDDQTVDAYIQELETRHFLIPQASDPEDIYAFRHALIQETVYGTFLRRDRQRLHDQAALAIEQYGYWLSSEQSEALAHHYANSSEPVRALPYLVDAGDHAARSCANETAIGHYRQALELSQQAELPDSELRLRAQMGLGQALKLVGEYAKATQTIKDALGYLIQPDVLGQSPSAIQVWVRGLRELADIQVREGAPGEAIAYLEAGLDLLGTEGPENDPHLWRLVIDRLAWVRFRQGELDEAYDLANQGVLTLDPGGDQDPITLASLYNTQGGVLWQKGDLAQAAEHVRLSSDLYGKANYLWGMANAESNLGILNYRLGNWQETLGNWEHTLAMRRTIGDVPHEAVTLSNLGLLHMSTGQHDQARSSFEAGLAIGQRLGENWITAHALASLAQLAALQGHHEEAQEQAASALALAETIGSTDIQVHALWILALARAGDGHLELGLKSARDAYSLAGEAGLQDLEADCLRVLGMLRARSGEWLEAETHFHESIEVCLQQKDPYRHGLAQLELGRLYQQLAHAGDLSGTGWKPMALDALHQAAERFEHLGAKLDLRSAQTLLDEIQAEAPTGLPEGAWHTATIVWSDLVPAPGIDEEQIFEDMTLAISALTGIAEEYEGQVVRRRDGLTIICGAPVAYEDDSERAVQIASRFVQHVTKAAERSDLGLDCRVAVSQGSVVAGHVGPRFHSEYVVKGRPVDWAERLAHAAPPGAVYVTEAVQAATERLFEFEPAPPVVDDLLPDRLVSKLVGLRERPAPTRGLPGMEAKFVGRAAALQDMRAVVDNLSQDLGGLIWIEGEPGIGKSRLMRELTAAMAADGFRIWRGRCTPHRTSHPFSLFTDLLANALGLQPTDTPEQISDKISRQVQLWPADVQATSSYLEALMGVEPSGLAGARLNSLQPEQLQRQIFVTLRRLFRSLAKEQPMVLLMDDLHWIDPVSAELLLFLLTMVTSVPILFVCAQRRQGADSPNDRLVRTQSLIASQTLRLRLERLSLIESEMLLAELLSQPDLPTKLTSAIVQRSDGNPYFIEEYVRMLIDLGHLDRGLGRWELDPGFDLTQLPLPSSLDTLVRSRIDALPPELKEVVQYSAVVGSPFEARLLELIPGLPNIQASLARLDSRLVVRPATEIGSWQFNHSLLETVTYNAMLQVRRSDLHLQVAKATEERWLGAEAEHAEELAHHYTRANESDKAYRYLVLAGERAAARYANEAALSFYEMAADQSGELADVATGAATELRIRLAAGLGVVYRELGNYGASEDALGGALTLIDDQGLPEKLKAGLYWRWADTAQKAGDLDAALLHSADALRILGEPAGKEGQTEASQVLASLAWTYFFQGQFDQAREACEKSLTQAESAGALNELATAENLLGGIYYSQSQWQPALRHTTRAMVLREQLGYTWGVASTLNNLGVLAQMSGQWSKAWSFFDRSLSLREELGDMAGVAISQANLGMLARDQGRLDLAVHHLEASLDLAIPLGMTFYVAHTWLALAQVQLWQGNTSAAQESLDACAPDAESLGGQDLLSEIQQVQADILLVQGTLVEAKAASDGAVELAVQAGKPNIEAAARVCSARGAFKRNDLTAARQALDKAEQIFEMITDELLAGRAAALSGQIAAGQGQFDQAEKELRRAREILSKLGAGRDVKQVQDYLRQLPRPDPKDLLSDLTV